MKRYWAIKWIKALRSGKYKQATKQLRTPEGYCCLGVLCTLTNHPNAFRGEPQVLPKYVARTTGIRHRNGTIDSKFDEYGSSLCLATINDKGASFEEIAKIIEKEWKKI